MPWEEDPTAQVICDLVHQDGRAVEFTPRNVLKRVVAAYDKRGLEAGRGARDRVLPRAQEPRSRTIR